MNLCNEYLNVIIYFLTLIDAMLGTSLCVVMGESEVAGCLLIVDVLIALFGISYVIYYVSENKR